MLGIRRTIGFGAGVIAISAILSACRTNIETTTTVPDGGTTPSGSENVESTDASSPDDAGPSPARSVTGTWEKVPVIPPDGAPIKPLASIFVRSATDVYVSEGASNLGTGYYRYDGTSWTGVRYSGLASSLVGLPSGELFGYGSDVYLTTNASDTWERFPQPQGSGGPALFYDLWGTSVSNLYASTSIGNFRFRGTSWSPISELDVREGTFAGSGADDLWFSSPEKTLFSHFDGTRWTNQWKALPTEITVYPVEGPYGLFASAPDNVWAIGRSRTVIHYDGVTWKIEPGPDDEWGCNLTTGWTSSKNNAWLVGKGGCIFHWDGTIWRAVPSGVTEDIYGIHGSAPEHVWIAPYSTTTVLRLKPE